MIDIRTSTYCCWPANSHAAYRADPPAPRPGTGPPCA